MLNSHFMAAASLNGLKPLHNIESLMLLYLDREYDETLPNIIHDTNIAAVKQIVYSLVTSLAF